MKKHLFLISGGIVLLGFAGLAWAQCPEEPFDNGVCDTLYVEVYDPVTDTWTEEADMEVPRDGLSASVVNGKIYAIGGWNPNMDPRTLSTVEEYTPESWQSIAPQGNLPTKWGEVKAE